MGNEKIRILFVSRGNIRSVMAQYMLQAMVDSLRMGESFQIDSASTSSEEVGSLIHDPAREVLKKRKIPTGDHVVRKMTWDDYDHFDYLIGMDEENIEDMKYVSGADPDEKIRKLLSFAGEERDIEDPWYTEGYEDAYKDIQEGLMGLLNQLKR